MTANKSVYRPLRPDEGPLPAPPVRSAYALSDIINDSVTMTGATAKDVFDAGVVPSAIGDTGDEDPGTGATGFALANHVHAHPALRGGDAHALASSLTHGFMSATDKSSLDSLVGGVLVIENRTSDPGSPVSGQIWLRTDL